MPCWGICSAFPPSVSRSGGRTVGWRSWPGTELPALAFDLGYRQVVILDSKIVRVDSDAADALESQRRRFEDKFGRPPGPGDPIFFDPDADEPRPLPATGMETATVAMLEAAGISPAWIYAYQNTGGLLPGPRRDLRHRIRPRRMGRGGQPLHQASPARPATDHQAEIRKLRGALTGMTLQMAADDPGYGASLAARLTDASTPADSDTATLREFLLAVAGHLERELDARPGVRAAACEYARAWAGTDLAAKLRGPALPSASTPPRTPRSSPRLPRCSPTASQHHDLQAHAHSAPVACGRCRLGRRT